MSETTPSVIQIAFNRSVFQRALIMALVVGTVLVSINHYDCCLAHGFIGSHCMTKVVMTFFVPYAVSTISSVQAIKCKACWDTKETGTGR